MPLFGITQIDVSANFNTAAIQIKYPANWDSNHNGYAIVSYKESDSSDWLPSYTVDHILENGQWDYRVSLFGLISNRSYTVRATLHDRDGSTNSLALPEKVFTTRANPVIARTNKVWWVAPEASHQDYTYSNPGALKPLLKDSITCGSTIMLQDGEYKIGDLVLNLRDSCPRDSPIVIMAENSEQAVFSGGDTVALQWKVSGSDPKLYSAALPQAYAYTNLLAMDDQRLYPYSTLGDNVFLGNYNLIDLNFGFDGFVRSNNAIWIKTDEGKDPSRSDIVISREFRGLTVNGFGNSINLIISGIFFQYYAKSNVQINVAYNAHALILNQCDNVVVDDCRFTFCDNPISLQGGCSNVTIQGTHFTDNIGDWSHAMIKKSFSNQSVVYPTSMGRSLENSSISYANSTEGGRDIVYRNNTILGSSDGISFRTGTTPIYNFDFHDNMVSRTFDGVEIDGHFSNAKVFNNKIYHCVASISAAPPKIGPHYFYRNLVAHMTSRENTKDDTYYNKCAPTTRYISQGIGIKTNIGSPNTDGAKLHFINNTFHSADSHSFVQFIWDDEWENITLINNIYYNPNNTLFFDNGYSDINGNTDTSFQFYSESDDYFAGNQPIATLKKFYAGFDCDEVQTVDSLQTVWSEKSKSDHIDIRTPFSVDPKFKNPKLYEFDLGMGSPLIENGGVVLGFYDFHGRRPDVGAMESDVDSTIFSVDPIQKPVFVQVFPNPFDNRLMIKLNEPQTIEIRDLTGRIWLRMEGKHEYQINTSFLPAGVYVLNAGYASKKLVKF